LAALATLALDGLPRSSFWSIARANAARSQTFQACTGALSTTVRSSIGTRSGLGLVGLKPQATQNDHAFSSSAPHLPPWAPLTSAAPARRSILPARWSGSAATMSTKRGYE